MLKTRNVSLLLIVLVCALTADAYGVTRVAKRLNMLEFYTTYASPLGSYNGIGSVPLVLPGGPFTLDAGDLFDPSFSLGISYGQLRNDHILVAIGFRYTKIETDERIEFVPADLGFHQYDLDINLNYHFGSLVRQGWTPYLGAGINAGLTTASAKGYDSESDGGIAFSGNFGVDIRLWWNPESRSIVTLSSINTWNIAATDDRPRYLQVGAGLRYWFRP